MDHVFTSCEHCAHRFEAPSRSAGGLTNCPDCGKATEVPGGKDVLWNVAVGLAALGTVIFVTVAYLSGGGMAAALAFAGCAGAGAIVRLSS